MRNQAEMHMSSYMLSVLKGKTKVDKVSLAEKGSQRWR